MGAPYRDIDLPLEGFSPIWKPTRFAGKQLSRLRPGLVPAESNRSALIQGVDRQTSAYLAQVSLSVIVRLKIRRESGALSLSKAK